ncbi:DUF885 family protein [Sphingomonas sp. S6]|jgi:uncharacterized protein (DUF885 family)|uniref:DUF885 family protein n=1 Tax=Sphingomonas sp. S6 TaxID=3368600 RepID=UPI000FA19696|nr:DUF885 family protein [uncultured Sphingomonas sp.]RTL22664.1 MAG: DUF885 family protein [Sphingomonadaceae bacterium]
MMRRRQVLAALGTGAASALAAPVFARTDDDQTIGAALDTAATLPTAQALDLLGPLSAAGASTGRRLDLQAARAGLAIDAALTNASDAATRFSLQTQRVAGNDARLDIVARDLAAAKASLEARAARLFDRLGIAGGTTGARFEALWRDPRWLFADDAAGRDAAVAAMRATLATIRPQMPRLIGPLPAACLSVDVRPLDPAEIAAGKGGYRILPATGVQGLYVVDLKDIRRRPRVSLPSVVAHELLPGHMAQMPLEALAHPHPLRLRYAAGFSEGWGVYAEMLMADAGLFSDPAAMLGHIHWMLFRVTRGLADIDLHVRGVDTDRAAARIRESLGESVYFAPIDRDVVRITSDPGLRAAEAWVPLRITAARPRARHRWPQFHTPLLAFGRRRTEQIAG